uniref:Uncharacterized protein n=1 Tax=Kalanchoe fedtschenkoi TaxID=63787 RepID=A0A7N0THJ2_KALFE
MRVWLSKIHCPSFICFCKPAQHLCAPPPPPPANLDSTTHRHTVVVHLSADKKEEPVDDRGDKVDEAEIRNEFILKSSIKRKVDIDQGEEGRKKTVQWMDVTGKNLVDVKEFETSESEDTDSESELDRGCICAIL